jgi:hypothetical protein
MHDDDAVAEFFFPIFKKIYLIIRCGVYSNGKELHTPARSTPSVPKYVVYNFLPSQTL